MAGERVPSGPSWMEGMRVDAEHFDRMARTLGRSNSRRRVLGGLLGGALGGLLTRLGPEEVGATHAGCRHDGTTCTRPGQCCSGRCTGRGKCQPCSRAGQCPQPSASQPCKQSVCTSAGRCIIKNKAVGTTCPADDDPCTLDICDQGACTHPNKPNNTLCGPGFCQDGVCKACRALNATCTDSAQCCQEEEGAPDCNGGTCTATCALTATPCNPFDITCCSGTCCAGNTVPGCPPGVDTCCGSC